MHHAIFPEDSCMQAQMASSVDKWCGSYHLPFAIAGRSVGPHMVLERLLTFLINRFTRPSNRQGMGPLSADIAYCMEELK